MDRDFKGPIQSKVLNQNTSNEIPTMNAFCRLHPRLRVEYVSADPNQDFVFKCVNCISEENVPQSSLIPINLILTSDDKTIFANFPITDRSLSNELRTLANTPKTGEQVNAQISSFFKEFRTILLHKLEIIEKKMTEKAKSISNFESIIEQYNRICAKNKLKAILNDTEKEMPEKSSEIKEICSEVLSKEAEHNSSIRSAIENIKTLQSAIDFEIPIKIKESILSQVDKIDIFLVEDFQHFQELIERKSTKNNQNISNLIKLVNNKFNGISNESCERLKEQLNQISFAFSSLEVPEVGKAGTYLESLNESSFQAIQKLVRDLAENQQANEVDYFSEEKEKLVAGDLVKLISNKANFCSNEYVEDVTRVMNDLERIFGLYQVCPPRIKKEDSEAFKTLNKKQLYNLAQLARKTNQITKQNAEDSSINSQESLPQLQENSKLIRRLIGKHKKLHYLANQSNSLSDSLDKILMTYPIFDLLPPISNKLQMVPIPKTFTKTNYENSQEIQMIQNEGSVSFSLDPSMEGQVVSDILDNQLGYLLKLKFNRPIAAAENGLWIGLIPNSSIHSNNVLGEEDESGFITDPGFGANVIIKGGLLNSQELGETQEFEFRFCISKQLFRFADSSYSNINQAKKKYFNPSEQYRFGVFLNNQNIRPADMLVEISEFSTIDPFEVTHFQ